MAPHPIFVNSRLFWHQICWGGARPTYPQDPGTNYDITTDWEGENFAGIDLAWYYNEQHYNKTCRI